MRAGLLLSVLISVANARNNPFLSKSERITGTPDPSIRSWAELQNGYKPAPEPCALVASALTKSKTIQADLALACLRSVPLDKTGDTAQVKGVKQFLEFHAPTAYLKNPAPGWLYPPTDIISSIDSIASKLENNKYTNEFDFQLDLYKLAASGYDQHLYYIADIVGVFNWAIPISLVSVSSNGTKLPHVYIVDELAAYHNKSAPTASPVSNINGIDVEEYLNQIGSTYGVNQDPDGNYNYILLSVPLGESTGPFGRSFLPFTEGTNITRADGSHISYVAIATTTKDFTGVKDGKTFFQKFCTPQQQSGDNSPPPQNRSPEPFTPYTSWTTSPSPKYYPPAVAIASDQSVAGYFPTANNDTAVLAIPTFGPADPVEFQNIVRRFLATAQVQGKKKLIIDLRGNGGGFALLPFDLFVQLFPHRPYYGGANVRATEMFNDIGKLVSAHFANVTTETASDADFNDPSYLSVWNYKNNLNVAGHEYGSWADVYGPVHAHGDNFTNIVRFNLDVFQEWGINITNNGNEAGFDRETVFEPKNIVMLHDGTCASACSIFNELAKEAAIKQIVFGGRRQTGPMQGVGGTKGSEVAQIGDILGPTIEAFENFTTKVQQEALARKYPDWKKNGLVAANRAYYATIDLRNQIRKNDDQITPLMFVYEAADYRRFYTAKEIFDQSLVWKTTYDVVFKNAATVEGSTNHPSSALLTGKAELVAPPAKARWNSKYPGLKSIRPNHI